MPFFTVYKNMFSGRIGFFKFIYKYIAVFMFFCLNS